MAMPGRAEPPGRLLGAGRSAEVYDLGGGRVLRRYNDRAQSAEQEAKIISWAGEQRRARSPGVRRGPVPIS